MAGWKLSSRHGGGDRGGAVGAVVRRRLVVTAREVVMEMGKGAAAGAIA